MVARGVPVRAIIAGSVLQWYFSWKRRSGFGGGNCHGGKVLCRDLILFCYVESGIFLYVKQCNATVLQLNWYNIHGCFNPILRNRLKQKKDISSNQL